MMCSVFIHSYIQNGKIRTRFGVVRPRDGQQFPVSREELYLDYTTRDESLDELIETDYVSCSILRKLANHTQNFMVKCQLSCPCSGLSLFSILA